MGYFNDACTIIECLHTFCRACIMRHFRDYVRQPQLHFACDALPPRALRHTVRIRSLKLQSPVAHPAQLAQLSDSLGILFAAHATQSHICVRSSS